MSDVLRDLDAGRVVTLDGGLATALEVAGNDLSGPLWSARLLQDAPGEVLAAHRAFVDAGAQVITTATYQLSAEGLRAAGRDPADLPFLVRLAVGLARESGAKAVAGSIGPYGAMLADGSEYRGGYGVDRDTLARFHAPRIEALLAAGVDLLAVETVPSAVEVAVLTGLLTGTGIPAWVSVTTSRDGEQTAEGQPLPAALEPALTVGETVAVGVNCVPVPAASAALRRLTGLECRLVVYPNVGARWDRRRGGWAAEPVPDPAPWIADGARLVGGCCGTTPQTLRELVRRVTAAAAADTGGETSR